MILGFVIDMIHELFKLYLNKVFINCYLTAYFNEIRFIFIMDSDQRGILNLALIKSFLPRFLKCVVFGNIVPQNPLIIAIAVPPVVIVIILGASHT